MTVNLHNLEKLNIKIRQREYNNLYMQLSCPVQTNFCLPSFRKTLYILIIRYLILFLLMQARYIISSLKH